MLGFRKMNPVYCQHANCGLGKEVHLFKELVKTSIKWNKAETHHGRIVFRLKIAILNRFQIYADFFCLNW